MKKIGNLFVTETNSSQRQNSKFGLIELWPSAFQCGSRSWELGGESLGPTQDERCGLAYMQGSGPGSEPLTKLEPRASKSYPSVRKRLDSSSLKQWSSKDTSWKLEWGKLKSPRRSQNPRPVLWGRLGSRFILPEWLGNPHLRNKCENQKRRNF